MNKLERIRCNIQRMEKAKSEAYERGLNEEVIKRLYGGPLERAEIQNKHREQIFRATIDSERKHAEFIEKKIKYEESANVWPLPLRWICRLFTK